MFVYEIHKDHADKAAEQKNILDWYQTNSVLPRQNNGLKS